MGHCRAPRPPAENRPVDPVPIPNRRKSPDCRQPLKKVHVSNSSSSAFVSSLVVGAVYDRPKCLVLRSWAVIDRPYSLASESDAPSMVRTRRESPPASLLGGSPSAGLVSHTLIEFVFFSRYAIDLFIPSRRLRAIETKQLGITHQGT